MVEDKWIKDVSDVAQTVAYTITRNYKGFAEVDDVKQELLEWTLKRPDKVQEWLNEQLPKQEYRLGIKRLARTFNRMADRYCRKEKAKKLGYSIHDEAFYSPALVEQLLPIAFNNNVETKDPNSEFVSNGGGDPATAGSFLASMYDIRMALRKLSIESYSMVRMKYEDGLTLADMVPLFNQSDSTISRKINTAIKQMSKELGGESPWI
jgi:DNA-directed RNA polymerase specialized sigma24 family protein